MQNIIIRWIDDTKLYVEYNQKKYDKVSPICILKEYKNDPIFMKAYSDFLNEDNLIHIENLHFTDAIFKPAPEIADSEIESNETTDNMEYEVNKRINDIIKDLELSASNDPYIQLTNICKVQKFLAELSLSTNSNSNRNINYNIDDFYLYELYLGLVKNECSDVTYSIIEKEVLKRIGIEALIVGLRGVNKKENHSANLIKLYGSYYYFDPTIEGILYKDSVQKGGKFIMSCAGMGSDFYEKWYKPTVIVPEKMFTEMIPVPQNIAKESIPSDMIARITSAKNIDFDNM